MAGKWGSLCRTLRRRRVFEPDQLEDGNLRRCLSVWDLIALGIGSSLGVGVYVLIGSVALNHAGPAIVLSLLIAAVAAIFAGMCYAEFGSRVPKAGSAYIYTYVTVGEFVAFIIGWNMILEAAFGTASVARGLSMYVDSMSNSTMSEWFQSVAPITSPYFSPFFDFFSFFVIIFLGVLLAVGVRESTMVNNLFTGINLLVIAFIIFAGAFKADVNNWSIPAENVPASYGKGGFFPYGIWGMLRGAAVCFYGFVGFDSISSTGEEVRNPRRAIPISIMSTEVIVFIAYAGIATVVTMMMPYYLQETVASIATSFTFVGWDWARWVVSIGAVMGISASLYGSLFPLPRFLYSMASDGLLFSWLAKLTTTRKSPTIATLIATIIIATLAAVLELNELVLMMCVGTLLSYTIVASCVIILRYRSDYTPSETNIIKQIFSCRRTASKSTSKVADAALILFICTCLTTAIVANHVQDPMIFAIVLHAIALCLMMIIAIMPQAKEKLTFKTPLVPIIPCLSIYVNINLMVLISVQTWTRVLIWIAIGIPVYIFCVCCYKQKVNEELEENIKAFPQTTLNGKPPVQIYVVSPTPPGTTERSNKGGDIILHEDDEIPDMKLKEIDSKNLQDNIFKNEVPIITEEIIIQHAYVEDNGEKEAKIIDLLDQVLQAEEDSYGEIISLKDQNENDSNAKTEETLTHRKSLSELSDAGSDASMGNQVLSKYDVIAQVHREDLPKLNEEEEIYDKDVELMDIEDDTNDDGDDDDDIIRHEDVTAFNDSDTNSRTDESGYSDTIDKTALNESLNNSKEEIPNIPIPPPLDENFFASPTFKKAYTISVRPSKNRSTVEVEEEENKPRESVQSNSSYEDTPMVFGSDKQMHFMSKLNNIFQNKIATGKEEDTQRKRSNSTGNVVENTDSTINRERPQIFLDLKREITAAQNLRHIDVENNESETDEDTEETTLSREDLKSKLENIFAIGGPQLLKTRLMKSNPPTPEESYQTDTSSTESIHKLPKMDKNDTLKRQKTKYGEVLNSFRLTLSKGDDV